MLLCLWSSPFVLGLAVSSAASFALKKINKIRPCHFRNSYDTKENNNIDMKELQGMSGVPQKYFQEMQHEITGSKYIT